MTKILVGLDRDGTINYDTGNLGVNQNWREELQIYPDAVQGIRRLTEHPDVIVIVATNQAGVAQGLFPEDRVKEVNASIDTYLRERGVFIDGWYYCPFVGREYARDHGLHVDNPWVKYNDLRKPCAGMLKQAAHDLSIMLEKVKVYFVGDKDVDVLTGINAGGKGILVHMEHNQKHYERAQKLAEEYAGKVFIVKDLVEAADIILEDDNI